MGINLNIPGAPKFDESLIPWMNTMAQRIQQALNRVNGSYSGNTAARLALANAPDGTSFYDTQLKRLYVRSGGAWVCPHPFGIIGRATLTSNSILQAAIHYPLQITGVELEAGRKTKVSVHGVVFANVVPTHCSISVCDSGGTIANQAYRILTSGGLGEEHKAEHYWTGLPAGTYSFRLGLFGGNPVGLANGPTGYSYIEVEDKGPA